MFSGSALEDTLARVLFSGPVVAISTPPGFPVGDSSIPSAIVSVPTFISDPVNAISSSSGFPLVLSDSFRPDLFSESVALPLNVSGSSASIVLTLDAPASFCAVSQSTDPVCRVDSSVSTSSQLQTPLSMTKVVSGLPRFRAVDLPMPTTISRKDAALLLPNCLLTMESSPFLTCRLSFHLSGAERGSARRQWTMQGAFLLVTTTVGLGKGHRQWGESFISIERPDWGAISLATSFAPFEFQD